MKLWTWVLAVFLIFSGFHAEAAKRMGGGKSLGQQSGNVTQRQAVPPAQTATKAPTPAPAAAPPAVAPKKPWGAMLGGLAAGLGLAWLASSLGLGAAMGQFMMFALLALVIMMAVGWFMRSRKAATPQNTANSNSPFAFQGASPASVAQAPSSYRPENVGNDASARPWERNSMAFDTANTATTGSMIGSGLAGTQSWGIPAGFDTEGFLKAAKVNFVTLQAAWDQSDINALRVMMTDTMLHEIQTQLNDREVHTGGPVNLTDVVMIEAQLLGIEDLEDSYLASVEFSGMIREEPSAGPSPFREVWNMTKSKKGHSGWLVAGVQALQ